MGYWNFEEEKTILGKSSSFFTTISFDFFDIYLSLIKKLSDIEKNIKFPKFHLTPPFMKMSYSYVIFNFENCSTLF